MKTFQTIALLTASNAFMTFAWYGHLHYKKPAWLESMGWIGAVFLCWGIAFFEYLLMVPANKIGYKGTGGSMDLFELKTLQEAISIIVFIVINLYVFKSEKLAWNHITGFLLIILAVYIIFRKW